MAAWCFVCDLPVDGDRCPECGRPPTVVEERPEPRVRWWSRISAVPRWVWLVVALAVVAALFPLLQSGFGLE